MRRQARSRGPSHDGASDLDFEALGAQPATGALTAHLKPPGCAGQQRAAHWLSLKAASHADAERIPSITHAPPTHQHHPHHKKNAAAAARPLPTARALLQAGKQQAAHGPNSAHSTGTPIPTSTVGGSDVFVVDTTTRRVGANGGVLANTVQDNARSGSTYDIIQTQR